MNRRTSKPTLTRRTPTRAAKGEAPPVSGSTVSPATLPPGGAVTPSEDLASPRASLTASAPRPAVSETSRTPSATDGVDWTLYCWEPAPSAPDPCAMAGAVKTNDTTIKITISLRARKIHSRRPRSRPTSAPQAGSQRFERRPVDSRHHLDLLFIRSQTRAAYTSKDGPRIPQMGDFRAAHLDAIRRGLPGGALPRLYSDICG